MGRYPKRGRYSKRGRDPNGGRDPKGVVTPNKIVTPTGVVIPKGVVTPSNPCLPMMVGVATPRVLERRRSGAGDWTTSTPRGASIDRRWRPISGRQGFPSPSLHPPPSCPFSFLRFLFSFLSCRRPAQIPRPLNEAGGGARGWSGGVPESCDITPEGTVVTAT